MAPSPPRVLLADADPAALSPVVEGLRARGFRADFVPWSEAPSAPAPASGDAAVIVVGAGVPNAAGAARRLARAHPGARLIVLARREHLEAARRSLLYSALENSAWALRAEDEPLLLEAVAQSVEASVRRSQFRSTLDRMNVRLASPAEVDPKQYRRLVVSDQYLASVLRHAPDAIISLDLEGRVLSWNAGAARLFQVAPAAASGQPLERLARWPAPIAPLIAAAVDEGFVRREIDVELAGGAVALDATFSAIRDSAASATAVAAILRDVTERRRIEAALAENEARFRMLANNIPQLAWMTDRAGAVIWVNQRWLDYTGKTVEHLRAEGWSALHHPDSEEEVVRKFRAHIEEGVAWEDTFRMRSRSGEYRWFLSRAFPIRDAAGGIATWFGTNTDIQSEREAQEALREADRRKDEFIGLLSHELRNPLAPIRNSLFLLERARGDEKVARRAMEVIRRQTGHLNRLVDDLLDVTRIARGKIELRRERADLAAIVRGTAEDYQPLLESRGVALAIDVPRKPVHAHLDGARVAQVLGNLLQNAAKFTGAGGEVEVRMDLDGETASVKVTDTGIGIEPELLARLFEPFVQGSRSMGSDQGGLGLGLALARGIAQLHGGTLVAQSAGRDQGSTFTLCLPLASPGADAPAGGAAAASRRSRKRRKVLIVDDNRDAAESMAQLVNLFGHEADVAFDGPSALRHARARAPDVVLCDIGLPGMDGYELGRRLRAQHRGVRLVAVSGYAQAADVERARGAGFDGHIAKPPQPEVIRQLLAGA